MHRGSVLKGSIVSNKHKAETTLNNETDYCGITESLSPSMAGDLGIDLDFQEKAQPAHSLELNLILYFLYISGLKYGVSEFDVLRGA